MNFAGASREAPGFIEVARERHRHFKAGEGRSQMSENRSAYEK
jgi:hypothetical protein